MILHGKQVNKYLEEQIAISFSCYSGSDIYERRKEKQESKEKQCIKCFSE